VLGAISASFIWVPLCGLAAFPFVVIGLALGVAGLIVSLATKRRQPLTMSLIGTSVCAVSLIVGILVARHTRQVARELAEKSQREWDAQIAAERAAKARKDAEEAAKTPEQRAREEAERSRKREEERAAQEASEIAADKASHPADLPPYEIVSISYDDHGAIFKKSRSVRIRASGDLTETKLIQILKHVAAENQSATSEISIEAGGHEVARGNGKDYNQVDQNALQRYRQNP
jgi:hypothetical protein